MVKENRFRQDLLYRINTIEIEVPPLRERFEDIPLLANHFLKHYAEKYQKNVSEISEAAITRMHKHPWPGNIRELQHAIERAVILNEEKIIRNAELVVGSNSLPHRNELTDLTMEEMEKQFILQTLDRHSGNVSHAARALGMTRTALYRRMKKHHL